MNLANLITITRIAIAPIYLFALSRFYEPGQNIGWALLAGFVLLAATDGIDGAVARKQGTVTKLGKLLDPVADKILLGGSFVVLSLLEVMPWWATIAILVREVAITIYRLIVIRDRVIPASSSGKSKTIMQCIAIGWLISPLNAWWRNDVFDMGYGLIYGAVFLTWWSAFKYIQESR
ncbi:MAG: CDP-diacylglycerol--glycerol-3-phosphate 3-phosphatidyltransferase [Rhodoluna sp.]